ncbi:DUF3054 domain-containing protein [Nesterenkonia halotolerans]|uniref:Peptidoglycan/LPS O-acetylase OafA/YrhL n=1 Tax=Nesterenkonia halotolerans TaxID=225325 RepID=A0ABR9J3T3_9MICC|nr:DUF3054 domain-containing protein [Nesterenkonia halotolerans]MBE1513565.1 peptidoglycan/LPS O-acetylase OafA/YrhL [Nesterenkonia halotolerans]
MSSSAAPSSVRRGSARRVLPWMLLALDGLLVIGFAAMGNRNHATGLALTDVLQTAAPFLLGLLISSLAVRFWRRPSRLWPDALVVILGTVALGMVLRVLSGTGGAQWSFVLVATLVLGVLLLARRIISSRLVTARNTSTGGQTRGGIQATPR